MQSALVFHSDVAITTLAISGPLNHDVDDAQMSGGVSHFSKNKLIELQFWRGIYN